MEEKEFKVNENITLKLENDQTIIYVNGSKFIQCMRLVLQIPINNNNIYEKINSIDEVSEKYNSLYEYEIDKREIYAITPEQEFWGHCSNLQVWVENNYDTHILHSNIAFPLLKELWHFGNPIAKKKFKEEIIRRLEEENYNVTEYLTKCGYLTYFNSEELEFLSHTLNFPIKLALWGYQNKAPSYFYENLDELNENDEFAKWALKNNAPEDFFYDFDKFLNNIELTKIGILNKVNYGFFDYFDKLNENVELAIWGAKNSAPYDFFSNFSRLNKDPPYITTLSISKEIKNKFLEKFQKKLDD